MKKEQENTNGFPTFFFYKNVSINFFNLFNYKIYELIFSFDDRRDPVLIKLKE